MHAPSDTVDLEERLSRPTAAVIEMMRRIEGDILFLGVAGKMGPTLARMARRATDEAGIARRIIGVSRFSAQGSRDALEQHGIETIACDLLDPASIADLPPAANVMFMAGMKFGATHQEPLTWAMNVLLPARIAEKYARSRIAAFSTGNIYGLVPATRAGSLESDVPVPVGEYAMSCLGRERVLEHAALSHATPIALIRLNYACDLRYGVLVDIARKVYTGQSIDVSMGYFNTIWQGDANALSLLTLEQAQSPAWTINLTGRRTLRVRDVAEAFGALFGKPVTITGTEAPDALLSDATRCFQQLGVPHVEETVLIEWVADWIARGGEALNKPTHFESRDGRF
ncbi:MAG: NAD(P)-dependent oxidoreductase [Verrucomicrobiales bacterium]|nr:NAD(P)-dependent oxidoreductase [Verrucomicrobiales bacterium]MCP5557608.1 NAD(P)-dependent oxidoreductase [Verrucomicrobiaceae bacterium]